jgi:hypothetical protein
MRKHNLVNLFLVIGFLVFTSCQTSDREIDEEYMEVIGEAEQQTPNAGYKLNLSYNGPAKFRNKFIKWADSVQQHIPSMVKVNEGIYMNLPPEQMGKKITTDMFQTSISYLLTVTDSSIYNKLTEDILKKNISFNLNIIGTFLSPEQKSELHRDMFRKAMESAEAKLEFINKTGRGYEIVGVEELDNTTPYGPDYYDFNRRMIVRLKVKARLD